MPKLNIFLTTANRWFDSDGLPRSTIACSRCATSRFVIVAAPRAFHSSGTWRRSMPSSHLYDDARLCGLAHLLRYSLIRYATVVAGTSPRVLGKGSWPFSNVDMAVAHIACASATETLG